MLAMVVCELFAMSSRVRAEVSFSLAELAEHGGRSAPHRDGWGIAYYEDGEIRLIKESGAAATSPCIRFIEQRHVSSDAVIAHIRRATEGNVTLRNTQPFARELGGAMHVFAHNGDLPGIFRDDHFSFERFHPIGETDSEVAFCCLLERIAPLFGGEQPAPLEARLDVFARFAADLAALGPANLLYCDGTTIFAHSHRRRTWPTEPLRPPGLHVLVRTCTAEPTLLHAGGVRISGTAEPQRVTLLASVPLSAEAWRPLPEGTVLALERGELVAERRS